MEEKEDYEGQEHSDGGQQCPQQAKLRRAGENATAGRGGRPPQLPLSHEVPRRRQPSAPVDLETGGMGTGDGARIQGAMKIPMGVRE